MTTSWAPSGWPWTLQLRETIERHVVLVGRRGDGARPAVRAMTAVIEEAVRAATAPASAA
jgi:hypothetical protein